MPYTLDIDDRDCGTFSNAKGLEAELRPHAHPIIRLTSGRLGAELRSIASRWPQRRPQWLETATLRCHDVFDPPRGIHLGPLRIVEVTGLAGDTAEALVFEAPHFTPMPRTAQTLWEAWVSSPPVANGRWREMHASERHALLYVTRHIGQDANPLHLPPSWMVDGRLAWDRPGLFLALGEAACGVGGYVGADFDGLVDRLRGVVLPTGGSTLDWMYGAPTRLASRALSLLRERGIRVRMG